MTASDIDISVVTPSFNMLGYLKRCCASVADQEDCAFEHIVVDGCSTDGTPTWLTATNFQRHIVEPDRGMYDAVNKGLLAARGRILAYLNCDEQYLPGALAFVKQRFDQDPTLDILFGDTLLIRPDGSLLSIQKSYKPSWPLIMASHLYLYSAAMFFRRRLVDDGELFDPDLKGGGDYEFVPRILRKGYRAASVRQTLAAFTMTGHNHSQTAVADHDADRARIDPTIPEWVRRLHGPLRLARMAIKAGSGGYLHRGPLEYSVYSADEAPVRRSFYVPRVSALWRTE
jgi:glycosyltransferase involved in cell wall biosynthesis